jgi:hypothetical protein
MVLGDRVWVGKPPNRSTISNPIPFSKMPLVYERAFWGTAPVNIDRDTIVDIRDPINPRGKGFDAEPLASAMCYSLKAPKGFPMYPKVPRALPNLEDPRNCWTSITFTRRRQLHRPIGYGVVVVG